MGDAPPPGEIVAGALAALAAGDADAALGAVGDVARLPAADRAEALRLVARVRTGRGDEAGALAAWTACADAAEGARQPAASGRCLLAGARTALNQGQTAAAEALLDRADRLHRRVGDGESLARGACYRCELGRALGQLRGAEAACREAAAGAIAAGNPLHLVLARTTLAGVLQLQGRHDAALAVIAELDALLALVPPGLRGGILNNLGWIRLQALSHGVDPGGPVEPLFEAAAADLEATGQAALVRAVQLNQAALAHARGRPDEAAAWLARRGEGPASAEDELFAALLVARLHLDAGRLPEATAAFEALIGLGSPTWRWHAAFGLARALQAAGRIDEAAAAFDDALQGLDADATRTPLLDSRAAYFADHRPLVDAAIEAALAAGNPGRAFALADADRARPIRALEAGARLDGLDGAARAAWISGLDAWQADRARFEGSRRGGELLGAAERAAWEARRRVEATALQAAAEALFRRLDEDAGVPAALPLPADPGGVVVASRHLPTGPHVFVWSGGAPRIHVGAPDVRLVPPGGHVFLVDEPATRALYLPLVEAGRSVSLIPYAAWLGRPGPRPTGPAIVLGDPDGTLPAAAREADAVAARLPGAHRVPKSDANPRTLLRLVDGARVFHFAGHGVLSTPWEAHLRLAGATRLEVADMLTTRARTGLVVLSGCETGVGRPIGGEATVGLAQAFLAAGASAVLATEAPIGDEDARTFIERFYGAGGAERPGEALRAAVDADRAAGGTTWRAWRLWGQP
ncbi:MAG: CHAT domain-containing protein [bacterium]